VLALLTAMLALGVAVAQDKAKSKATKGRLPTGWSKLLKLDKEQGEKIRQVDLKARLAIDELNEKIRQVRLQARRDQIALLTPEQKKILREQAGGGDEDVGKDKGKGKGKKDK
jgi:hypothetical protein